MSDGKTRPKLETYPRRYFDASPTWFAWNSLTSHGVQRLREEPGQGVFFHLNHPIQYVSVTGLASQIELGGGAAVKFCFITLDDGSGELLNVKVTRQMVHDEYISETTVEGLTVDVKLGLPTLFLGNKQLVPGQCIRVRGPLEIYRGRKQIIPKRVKMMSGADEIKAWAEVARWKTLIDKPWTLTTTECKKIDEDLEAERRRLADRQLRKRAWHARLAEKQASLDRRAALKAQKDEVKYNEGALPGSDIIKAPWEA
ncbi:hypothetical protein AMS68_004314 [Peltaster fructicola]|uniref:CST complex subunit Stn1 N-terminal domain-containing protein n=1 Tax=Peltaster fructicola TaxID=286661 RepID=A0A6H0XVL2_9PEZI|nr:hypothetical protein AMS68_004314 [Peltaster fructicola]